MKTNLPHYLLPLALAIALPAAAQTKPATRPVAHHATAVHHTSASGGCVTLPQLASSIPTLSAGSSCARPLYTLTRTPDTKIDYVSPLVSAKVHDSLGSSPSTYSLDYIDTKVGTGELVQAGKYVSVKYTGYLTDGKKFDSSYDHPGAEPIDFPYGEHRVIQGWDTGFEGMRIGGKRRLFIPYELAYGEPGRPPTIPAKSMLVFDVEVVAQSDKPPAPKAPPTPPHPATPPPAKPETSSAGTAAPPPTTSSTPAASTKPATAPTTQPKK